MMYRRPEGWGTAALVLAFFIVLALFFPVLAQAENEEDLPGVSPGGTVAPVVPVTPDHRFTAEGPVLVMFYNTNCGDCMRTLPFVQQYVNDHPELESHLLDIRESPENWDLFTTYKEAYGTGAIPVPSVFVGDRVLVGYEEITGSLDSAVKEQISGLSGQLPYVPAIENLSAQELTIPLIITAGLADGINPCAFSVLIILLVYPLYSCW